MGSEPILKPQIVKRCRERYAAGERIMALAVRYKVSYGVMRKAIRGITHSDLPGGVGPRPGGKRCPQYRRVPPPSRRVRRTGIEASLVGVFFGDGDDADASVTLLVPRKAAARLVLGTRVRLAIDRRTSPRVAGLGPLVGELERGGLPAVEPP